MKDRAPLDPTAKVAYRAPLVTELPPPPYRPYPLSPVLATVQPADVSALLQLVTSEAESVVANVYFVWVPPPWMASDEAGVPGLGQAGTRSVTSAAAVSAVFDAAVVGVPAPVVAVEVDPPDEQPARRSASPISPAPVSDFLGAPISVPTSWRRAGSARVHRCSVRYRWEERPATGSTSTSSSVGPPFWRDAAAPGVDQARIRRTDRIPALRPGIRSAGRTGRSVEWQSGWRRPRAHRGGRPPWPVRPTSC